ncbi:type IV secretion protein Rhs, partial [Gilliamella apicola]
FNRRTSKTVNGKTTEFIWQGHKLIAETDNDKHWQSYLYEQDSFRPLALVQGNAQQGKTQLYWYQNDQLGTPIGLTDGFGETLYECQYNGYGQIIDETYHEVGNRAIPDNPLRFQGQYYDEETGLHYNLNRYYDPFVGRYITQDPIKLIGGLNFYQYCQNPVNWVDPLGFKNIPGCGKQNRPPLSEKKAREIAGLEKDQRPANVLEYLSKEYVDAHLALFEQEGASFIVVDDWLVRDLEMGHKTLAPDKFVALRSDMEKILAEYRAAGNDRRILCERLGLNPKDIEGARIYVVHIKPNDIRFKFGMSTGKEVGANDKWLPGGWTSGGIREAILRGSEKIIHNGSIKKLLKYFEKWEEL